MMRPVKETQNRRILVVDDNPAIHEDFRKILGSPASQLAKELSGFEAELFGEAAAVPLSADFEIDSALQGREGLEKVRAAAAEGRPYAVAFVDVRMPPGWDGVETISHLTREFPDLQIVVCTAYSDYSWDEITKAVNDTDHVLVLKKPFDNIEVLQMAHALAKKWQLTQIANRQMAELDALVAQRTAELQCANVELAREISERAATQESLSCSEERFSKAFHGSPVPMAIQKTNAAGFLDANRSFVQLLGASSENVLAGTTALWDETDTAERLARALQSNRGVRNLAAAIRNGAGELRQVVVAAEKLDLGSEPYLLLILQDVTERNRLENELRHAQKMEAVGRLAAGVAHDFNNILTVILGNTSLQLRNPKLDQKVAVALKRVVQAAERATALTRQLLAYSRKQIIQRRAVSLNEVAEQTIAMLRRVIGEDITVELQLAPELPTIFADATSLEQVVMNLAVNSRDAMPNGGRINLSSALVEVDRAHVAQHPDAQLGRYVRLEVRDTGHGISPEVLEHIFEPFFTTKEVGKGTGMGLATVYGVLKQHGGWIEVESAVGRGTAIRTYFPLSAPNVVEAPVDEAPSAAAPEPVAEGTTILVVEDEDVLRDFVCEALASIGCRVLSAANGNAALELWENHRSEVDLLLTDVVMPDSISGRQLARTLVAERPDLKVIYTSGYSAELLGTDFERENKHGFLAKPYLPERLASTVASYLQHQPAGLN